MAELNFQKQTKPKHQYLYYKEHKKEEEILDVLSFFVYYVHFLFSFVQPLYTRTHTMGVPIKVFQSRGKKNAQIMKKSSHALNMHQ